MKNNYCPLHCKPRLQGVWESSIEEDDEMDDEDIENLPVDAIDVDDVEADGANGAGAGSKFMRSVAAIYTDRDKNRLGLAGFIPRKLSTISSRSCSVNPDYPSGDANDASPEPAEDERRLAAHCQQSDGALSHSDDHVANAVVMTDAITYRDAIGANMSLEMIDDQDDDDDDVDGGILHDENPTEKRLTSADPTEPLLHSN